MDVSIEYAHIYTNQRTNDEHNLSLEVLGAVTTKLKDSKVSLVVMVDDYSFPDPSFDYDNFLKWLGEQGYRPDILFRESQLIPLCDGVLKLVKNDKLKSQITDYVKAKKYPCSLFIAAWYLLRLGKLHSDIFPRDLYATELINILPESFKPFEDKAFEIIRSTEYSETVDAIENKYFQGRLIA